MISGGRELGSRTVLLLVGSAALGVAVAAGSAFLYRQLASEWLLEREESVSASISTALAGLLTSGHDSLIDAARSLADDSATREQVARLIGSTIVGLALYSPDGRRIFSSGFQQSTGDGVPGTAFERALGGKQTSTLTFPRAEGGGDGTKARAVVVSHLPYRAPGNDATVAVFEIHSDVTRLLAQVRHTQWRIAAGTLGGAVLLGLFIYPFARRAEAVARKNGDHEHTSEQRLRYQANHDPLTQIPNRRSFQADLDAMIRRAKVKDSSFGVMFVDLDRFKVVNDSLGHKAGDLVLQSVSQRIVSCMRRGDSVYRMGGDEFTVILGRIERPDDAVAVARRINSVLADPIAVRQHDIAVGASIGISTYPADGNTPDLLVRNADAAMYAAKEAGRGGFAFYSPQLNARYTERLALEAMLRKAAAEDEYVLYYQPRISTRTEKLVGFEALLRWRHPRQGIVLPGHFIGVLEDTGLILRVGAWVLFKACRQAKRWKELGLPLRVSVNVSARQFRHERFVEVVNKALTDTGLPPERLELELTESLLMHDSDKAVNTMQEIRKLGVSLSIDDFGTGYSSLSYLARLPVDYLKIDRSFVTNALTNERDDAVISSIVVLARSLGLGVVAEGVEHARQALFLKTMGCSELQGNLFGEARPSEELTLAAPNPATAEAGVPPATAVLETTETVNQFEFAESA